MTESSGAVNPATVDPEGALPSLATPLAREEIDTRLLKFSKRGKLAGYSAGRPGELFRAEAHGHPFDFTLVARASSGTPGVEFHLEPVRRGPILVLIILVLAAGPGLWLTHSMMETYFSWYRLSLAWTAVWYEALTIVPVPWVLWRAWKRSKVAAILHASETIRKIAPELNANVVGG